MECTVRSTVKRFCRQNTVKSTVRSILPTKSMDSTLDCTPDPTLDHILPTKSLDCTHYCTHDHTFHLPNIDSVSKSLDCTFYCTHYCTYDSTIDGIVANYIIRNCIKIPQNYYQRYCHF